MTLLLVLAIALLLAVLISALAQRSIVSTAVLFLLIGFAVGDEMLGLVTLEPRDHAVSILATLALFSILFTDGMKVGVGELREAWHLPGRALVLGMPLTFLLISWLAHMIVGLPWAESFLLGAILSPTDPVFASALIGREEVPRPLRRLLNVESGVNDGLALPVVIFMLAYAGSQHFDAAKTFGEVAAGVAFGTVIPWVAVRLEKTRFFRASVEYEPLNAFAIGLLVFAACHQTHANEFLGGFAAGIVVATYGPEVRESFHQFGELIAELLKLAALLVFGTLMSIQFLQDISLSGYVFAAATLLLVRPVALGIALIGSSLNLRERAAAAWFGPKGFASVVYAIIALKSGSENAEQIFHLVAVVIAGSVLLHSSTDVLVARQFRASEQKAGKEMPDGEKTPETSEERPPEGEAPER